MTEFTPEYFMQRALDVAAEGLEKGEQPIGAVIVLNNQIIASAHTLERASRRFLVHAELRALEMADQLSPFPGKRRNVKLFTNLEPCLMCLGAAMSFFLGEIYYGLESPGDGAVNMALNWQRDESVLPGYQIPKIQGGLLRDESQALFRQYLERYPTKDSVYGWVKTLTEL